MVPKKVIANARLLKRSTLQKDNSSIAVLEEFEPMNVFATKTNEDKAICEMSHLKSVNKPKMLQQPQSDKLEEIFTLTGYSGLYNSSRKGASTSVRANSPVTVGLSDLGPNTNFTLPKRPATTGRTLPHIGHRFSYRDKAVVYPRLPLSKTPKSRSTEIVPTNECKVEGLEKDNVQDTRVKSSADSHQETASVINSRRQQNMTKSVVDVAGLNKLSAFRHPTAPPQRRMNAIPTQKANFSCQGTSCGEHQNVAMQALSDIKTRNEKISSNQSKPLKVDSVRSESNFKPTIRVQNIQLNDQKVAEKLKGVHIAARSLPCRPIQDKERENRVRKTYPPRTNNLELPTVTKGRQKRTDKY